MNYRTFLFYTIDLPYVTAATVTSGLWDMPP